MKTFCYKTKNTCSTSLRFTLDHGKLYDVIFKDGCNGNLCAIAKLVDGMPADKVIQLLRGNTCGKNATSCADQLAIAVESALQQKEA